MLSKYIESLDKGSKIRYLQKISQIGGKDPYCFDKQELSSSSSDNFPSIMYMDIVNYLVYGKSAYTAESFKAYKSLEAYNQFVCGWVNDVAAIKFNTLSLVIGKVRHSQRISEKPLVPWVIATMEGTVNCAHCTCMAGLGESCTHVAALLFYVQDLILNKENQSCTSVAAYWNRPSKKTVEYLEVKNIDFSTPHSKMSSPGPSYTPRIHVPGMSDTKFMNVLEQLQNAHCQSAIMNVVPPFNAPIEKEHNLNLKDLFEEQFLNRNLQQLQDHANEFRFKFSIEDIGQVEEGTKLQTKSPEWFKYRTGRITASNMKAACHTNIHSPSMSILKKICYPSKCSFSNKAMRWGCEHEKHARSEYSEIQSNKHTNFKLTDSGLIISKEMPFLGASPDGLVCCTCCGRGCIEIKCPYCVRDCDIHQGLEHACLEKNTLRLSKKHAYYYQVQSQIFVSEREYCDFVLWTKSGMHVERIFPDLEFWSSQCEKAEKFFRLVILPELFGKVFTVARPDHGGNSLSPAKKRPHVVYL